MGVSRPCARCGFEMWHPLAALEVSHAGLYDDGRFPGRVIVSLDAHHEHLDDLPPDLLLAFLLDVRRVSMVLRGLPGVDRTNVSVLGNQVAHVHAHVVPRRATDPNPGKAPWDGAGPKFGLPEEERNGLLTILRSRLS